MDRVRPRAAAAGRAPAGDVAAYQPLRREFFAAPTEAVAVALMGMLVVRELEGHLLAGRIVEVEAYGGPEDLASHARAGLTRRTAPMHGPVGHAYVYLVYGMHYCLNVVARPPDTVAGAVLIRALEPVEGTDYMRANRGRTTDPDARLCAGPARLTQALAVDRAFDGHDLTAGTGLWLAIGEPRDDEKLAVGPRIGVGYAGEGWADRPWRFYLAGNPSVSR